MKQFFSILLFFIMMSFTVRSQTFPRNKNNEISYDSTVVVTGVSQERLYTQSKLWIGSKFKSAKDVIQVDDPRGGTIMLKAFSDIYIESGFKMVGVVKYKMWYTITIVVKDTVANISIHDIYTETYPQPNQYNGYSRQTFSNYPFGYEETIRLCKLSPEDLANHCATNKLTKQQCKLVQNERSFIHAQDAYNQISKNSLGLVISYANEITTLEPQEIKISSDEALTKLKRAKDILDLGLITIEEFEAL